MASRKARKDPVARLPLCPLEWPPSPHDPRERVRLFEVGGWEVRDFPEADPKRRFFARKGLLHLQLWHPQAWFSVLTPSLLTRGEFELFPVSGGVFRGTYLAAQGAVLRETGVKLPGPTRVYALHQWFLEKYRREVEAEEHPANRQVQP